MVGVALLVFPKLALGLSGFETGVAVMPHVKGDPDDTEERPAGRIRGTRKLLTTAALIMSVFLIAVAASSPRCSSRRRRSSPAARPTAARWPTWPTSTSATASARSTTSARSRSSGSPAPRRWPACSTSSRATCRATAWRRDWAARRAPAGASSSPRSPSPSPVVFDADVDAQGGAYATGVLVLITSASVAVTLVGPAGAAAPAAVVFGVVSAVFVYTTWRTSSSGRTASGSPPASSLAILVGLARLPAAGGPSSCAAPASSSTRTAEQFIARRRALRHDAARRQRARRRDADDYRDKVARIAARQRHPEWTPLIFVEVTVTRPVRLRDGPATCAARSATAHRVLTVRGLRRGEHDRRGPARTSATGPAACRTSTSRGPRATRWLNLLRFLFFGAGEIAPVTREVLREAEPVPEHRPKVHVG